MTDERTTPELLPCPFCGGTNIDTDEWSGNDAKSGPGCGDCGALGESIKAWNRRAPVAAPAADGLPALPKPPTLPHYLLDQIGDYGMARSDSIGQIEVQYRWEVLISYIKRYAGEYALDAIAADRRTRAGAESTSKTAETRMDTGSGASARVGVEHDHSEGDHAD